jgi:dolichyl-phosphate-mannose--protein O-mannosyl transferase
VKNDRVARGAAGWLDPLRADLMPGVLFLLAILLFAPRLDVPPTYMFDEVYHSFTAGQYAVGNPDAFVWDTTPEREHVAYMWNHPPAGVLAITGGILLWGDNAFGWRFAGAVFGAAGVVLVYVMAARFTRRRTIAALAAALVLLDTLWFAQSRIGMLDVFGTVFATAALFSLYGYLVARPERIARMLAITGVFLGLALTTKWNAAFVSTLCGLLVVYRAVRSVLAWRRDPDPGAAMIVKQHLVGLVLGFAVIPVAVYLAGYIPFFLTGHDWSQFVELQKQIFFYHSRLEATHPSQSHWWEWPIALSPVWYYANYTAGKAAHIYAGGNPLLYWAFVPAVLATAHRWWRQADPAAAVLLIGFFGQWLPWALSPRIAFAYHFLPTVPFGCLAVAWVAATLWRRGGAWRYVVGGYLLALLAYFVLVYPLLTAIPLDPDSFLIRHWYPSWNR